MKHHRRTKYTLYTLFSLFVSLLVSLNSFAFDKVDPFSQNNIAKNQPKNPPGARNQETYSRRPYNAWIWGGVGFLFTNKSLEQYIDNPTMYYQLGIAKSVWDVRPATFVYLGFATDFAYSKKNLPSIAATTYQSLYYFSNQQLFFGYEEGLGTRYLSAFVEAGGAFQQRQFLIRQVVSTQATDYLLGVTFGGTFNMGLNIKVPTRRSATYLFRLAMNFMVSTDESRRLIYDDKKVNVNQLSYSPTVSFGVRF